MTSISRPVRICRREPEQALLSLRQRGQPRVRLLLQPCVLGAEALLALAAIVYDSVRQRWVNSAFVIGGVLLILSFPLRMLLMGTSGWIRAATWLVQFAPT